MGKTRGGGGGGGGGGAGGGGGGGGGGGVEMSAEYLPSEMMNMHRRRSCVSALAF